MLGVVGELGIFGIVMLGAVAVGTIGAVGSVARVVGGLRSRTWPTVEGTVVSSSLRRRLVPGGRGARHEYLPEIAFEYELGGRRYVSEQVAVGRVASSFAAGSERIVDDHPPGARVTVHHHPTRPEYAVLLTGARSADLTQLAVGLAIAVAGLVMLAQLGIGLDTVVGAVRRFIGS
jgi:hypothetical protein